MTEFKGLVPFFSTDPIDEALSDLTVTVNKPRRAEDVMTFDAPWEGNGTDFGSIVKEDGFYRFYYETWSDDNWYDPSAPFEIHVCYAESKDGINWVKPSLGLVELNGSTDNNVIIKSIPDNITVMKDENPLCPPEMRYKAVMTLVETDYRDGNRANVLGLMVSEDGISFTLHSVISRGLAYDTQNTLHYDKITGKYFCYIRAYEQRDPSAPADPRFNEENVRTIRVIESRDLENWSEPRLLDFGDAEHYPLYTNCISKYPYDERYFIGFPTRYVERRDWSDSYESLCGRELRKKRMGVQKRLGLALSDCLFMSSTDGVHFHRFEEATLTSGAETGKNWVYGDCFPSVGQPIITPSAVKGEPDELSIYVFGHHWMDVPSVLTRYVYRKDGFASVKASYKGGRIVTKPFTLDSSTLTLNMSTSARGGIYVNVLDSEGNAIEGYSSCELFGDTLCKPVSFPSPLEALRGKSVRLEFVMKDAELYSMELGE